MQTFDLMSTGRSLMRPPQLVTLWIQKRRMMGLYANGNAGQDLKNAIKMQADIAKRRDNRKWLSPAAREAAVIVEETFLDSSWVDENLYSDEGAQEDKEMDRSHKMHNRYTEKRGPII